MKIEVVISILFLFPVPTINTGPDIVYRYGGTDGIVQRSEAVQAVIDYFGGVITTELTFSSLLS